MEQQLRGLETRPPVLKAARRRREQVAQVLVIAALCAAPAWVAIHMAIVNDPDVWWHLRTGEWISQHHAVPHVDPFSIYGAGRSWAAYSWLFDLVIFHVFERWGLVGILATTATMVACVSGAIYHMIRRMQPDFTIGVSLTCLAWGAMMPIFTPRPWLFTMLFFALELDIVMRARRNGEGRELLWLPLIFGLWANLHIQFVDGLVVLALALAESISKRWWSTLHTQLSFKWISAVFIACLLAPMANPYGYHIYGIARELATQPGVLNIIEELHALPFRLLANFLVLGLALISAFALGRQRRFVPFEIALLIFASFASFRSQRDVWVLVISACAILSGSVQRSEEERQVLPFFAFPLTAIATALVIFLGFHLFHVDNALLESLLAKVMPVGAVKEVKAKGYEGPLYNNYDWGGFFIWYLKIPVSIDGRAALHGSTRMERFTATWNGEPHWINDPDLNSAGLVIGPVKSPLVQLLCTDRRFKKVFEDEISVVFTASSK
jgi:hypothetical protein